MLLQDIKDFIEARTEKVDVTHTKDYSRTCIEKEQAKAALQLFFTDTEAGNLLLDRYDNAAYAQAVVEIKGAYQQGFIDGIKSVIRFGDVPTFEEESYRRNC